MIIQSLVRNNRNHKGPLMETNPRAAKAKTHP
jgi:hypothetical protein